MWRGRRAGKGTIAIVALATVVAAGAVRATVAEGQRGARVGQPAPEVTGGPWLNSEPLSLVGLRGRVVLVEFWTYG
jgi:hypothetical protein